MTPGHAVETELFVVDDCVLASNVCGRGVAKTVHAIDGVAGLFTEKTAIHENVLNERI